MPITRTVMIDDDGSGTTGTILNNAWLQTIYNQIDATVETVGSWTLTDQSGAGLTFAGTTAYAKVGRVVFVWINMNFPVTANAAQVQIGTLPFPCGTIHGGLFSAHGVGRLYYIAPAATKLIMLNPTTGAQLLNSDLSGAGITATGYYLVN